MTTPLSIVVLSTDFENFTQIRDALAADARLQLLSGGNDTEQVYDDVVRLKPSAAIVCLGVNADPAIALIEKLNAECPGTAIISVAKETSAELILRSLRAGAREFLRLPIDAQELRVVVDRIGDFRAAQSEPKKMGRMIAVFSVKGGCGASFIAVNVAACAAGRTALVDLNLETGDLPLFLGLNPKHTIADLAARCGKLDSDLIAALVTPYSDALHLVAAPKEVDPIDKIKPEHVFEVLQKLRESYDCVVLDTQHLFDPITLAALDQADHILLVLTLDIPAIRSAARALKTFDRVGYPRKKIFVVVNRWSKQVDFSVQQVEEFLGAPVASCLLSDYPAVVDSINRGVPLVTANAHSKIAKELVRVAEALTSDGASKAEPKPKRPWNFFLKGRSPEQGAKSQKHST
jgi:pilus assembly protein CpaE